jgi:hypothetical protein
MWATSLAEPLAINEACGLAGTRLSSKRTQVIQTQRVYPAKSRYCECVVGCEIFEGFFEVFGDEVVVAGEIRFGRWHLIDQGDAAAPGSVTKSRNAAPTACREEHALCRSRNRNRPCITFAFNRRGCVNRSPVRGPGRSAGSTGPP